MKSKFFIRLTAMLLVLATFTISFSGCMTFPNSTPTETTAPTPGSEISYFEHYISDDLFANYFVNQKWAHVEQYKYTNAKDAIPMYMGGYPYYGGFVLQAHGYSEQPKVVFDVSEYEGKTISFVMGSTQTNGYQDTGVAVIKISLDGTQVLEKKIAVPDTPEWYTLDLTGKSEISFEITQDEGGINLIGIAELTVWDNAESVVHTAHVRSEGGTRAQLVKDLYPYLFQEGLYYTTQIYSNRELPSYMDSGLINYCTKTEPVSVGGKTYMEAFGLQESEPLMGESSSSIYFNTEEQYGYLSFMVGGEDVKNAKAGTAWLTVYADDKIVHEELVTSNELPKRYTVAINNCKVLHFEVQYESGGTSRPVVFDAFVGKTENDVAGTAGSSAADLPEVCKLVSNIKPYAMSVAEDDPVFDGSSAYHTFTMAGRKYNEGIILFPEATILNGSKNSYACFNLEGQFKYMTFKAGLLDKSPQIMNDTLKIYLDGELAYTINLTALDLPTDHTIELKNCNELKFELVGRENTYRPAYGLSEMVVYKNEVVANDLFPDEKMNYPDSMPLIENIRPYMSYNASAKEKGEQIVFDGSTKKEYFEINGEKKYAGVILKTSVHLDLLGVGGGADAADILIAQMASSILFGDLAILAAGVLYENSFAGFDLRGEFSKVTFTVACSDPDYYISGMDEVTELQIGSNEKLMDTITLSRDMQPTTYTVDIENTEQLFFFLKCGNGSSAPYAIYDIIVEK